MKQTTIMLVMLVTFFTGSLDARADSGNPFGFETNKHPLEYEHCKKEPRLYRGHGYKCSSAPRPHPDLDEYTLQFVEDAGLCFIVGHSSRKKLDLVLVERFKGQISKKYGPPTTQDKRSGIGKVVDSLAKALGKIGSSVARQSGGKGFRQGSRDKRLTEDEIRFSWSPKKGFKGLGDVIAISMQADQRNVQVTFVLAPFNACMKKIDEKRHRAF